MVDILINLVVLASLITLLITNHLGHRAYRTEIDMLHDANRELSKDLRAVIRDLMAPLDSELAANNDKI